MQFSAVSLSGFIIQCYHYEGMDGRMNRWVHRAMDGGRKGERERRRNISRVSRSMACFEHNEEN